MPCYMTGSARGDAEFAADEARKECTRLTDMLCRTLRVALFPKGTMDADILEWWEIHKTIDHPTTLEERESE